MVKALLCVVDGTGTNKSSLTGSQLFSQANWNVDLPAFRAGHFCIIPTSIGVLLSWNLLPQLRAGGLQPISLRNEEVK
jgi:hypothetical protein